MHASVIDVPVGDSRGTVRSGVRDRLKEGANINKSLATIGRVIKALADQPKSKLSKKKGGKKHDLSFVPCVCANATPKLHTPVLAPSSAREARHNIVTWVVVVV